MGSIKLNLQGAAKYGGAKELRFGIAQASMFVAATDWRRDRFRRLHALIADTTRRVVPISTQMMQTNVFQVATAWVIGITSPMHDPRAVFWPGAVMGGRQEFLSRSQGAGW